eukprot:22391-Eustigmatos_ZCMA.PRE.1
MSTAHESSKTRLRTCESSPCGVTWVGWDCTVGCEWRFRLPARYLPLERGLCSLGMVGAGSMELLPS